jgi:hypothetical protein
LRLQQYYLIQQVLIMLINTQKFEAVAMLRCSRSLILKATIIIYIIY